ncbi:unnamed protein product, partial [Prorocentrum cordatum]
SCPLPPFLRSSSSSCRDHCRCGLGPSLRVPGLMRSSIQHQAPPAPHRDEFAPSFSVSLFSASFSSCVFHCSSPSVALLSSSTPALHREEDDSGEAPSAAGTRAVVCLVEVPEQSFKHVASLAGGPGQLDSLVPATALSELPEGDVRMSAPLPSCYAWASAMRVTSSRGVCSVYAWRARRLLTLDLEADPEDDCDDDEAVD